MWMAGQGKRLFCAACLWGLAFSLWGEPASICLSGAEVELIRQELANMRLSVSVLRESQERSDRESQRLRRECEELEGRLQRALVELETSGGQLIQSTGKSAELETSLQTLRLEYKELSERCRRLKTEATLWRTAAGVLAAALGGVTVWALLK